MHPCSFFTVVDGECLRKNSESEKSKLPDSARYAIICKWSNRVTGWADLPFLQNGGDAYEKSF